MSDSSFDFNLFIKESKDVLVNPKSYFSTMKTTGGMAEPLIKAVIYGAIAGAITFIWSLLGMGALGGAIGIMAFIWSIIAAIIGLFIGAVIVLVISSICKGNTDFEANMRVTAAVMVMMPISSLFGFAGHLNLYLGIIFGLAVYIFALWLLYNGLVEALKTNAETTKIVSYVLIAIIVLIMLLGFKTRKYMYQFNDNLKELPKEIEKN
jgi:hypothetical protein